MSPQTFARPQEAFVLTVAEKKKWTFRKTEISLAFLFLTLSFLLDGPIYFGTIILSLQQVGLFKHLSKSERNFKKRTYQASA